MPGVRLRAGLDPDGKQLLGNPEQAVKHFGQREIHTQRIFREVEAILLELFPMVGHIPGRQFVTGKLCELSELGCRHSPALVRQLAQELHDLLN